MKVTELLQLEHEILVKMELNNLSGSHKFRAADYIIQDAIRTGKIDKNTTVIEKTGGNFGFGLLVACLKHEIPVELAIGLSFSQVKKNKLEKLGAKLIGIDMLKAGKSPKEVIDWHLEHQENLGKKYFYTDQFNNMGSYQAHLKTGQEICNQLKSDFPTVHKLTLVACAGTGASFMGISDTLKAQGYELDTILVEPEGCDSQNNIFIDHPLEGMSVGVTPPFLKWEGVSTQKYVEHDAIDTVKKDVFLRYGLFIGNTSAACYKVAQDVVKEVTFSPQHKVLTFFYDSGIWYS